MHAEQTHCHGHHEKDDESIKYDVQVEGPAECHAVIAGISTIRGHSVVAAVVSVFLVASAHLEGSVKMTSAPSSCMK